MTSDEHTEQNTEHGKPHRQLTGVSTNTCKIKLQTGNPHIKNISNVIF